MVSVNLDGLDHVTAVRLRARAVGNGRSIEEEALNIIRIALDMTGALPQPKHMGKSIHELFKDLGIVEVVHPSRSSGEPIQLVFEDSKDDNR
ncbi:MAG: plasmid stabilization protein [Dehalococcoidia bacterium]|nr:plasmid stabilization protein [Dehalococcoidia bacterium]